MNIADVGLGSMGRRRIRLMKEMYPKYNLLGLMEGEIVERRHQISMVLVVLIYWII